MEFKELLKAQNLTDEQINNITAKMKEENNQSCFIKEDSSGCPLFMDRQECQVNFGPAHKIYSATPGFLAQMYIEIV